MVKPVTIATVMTVAELSRSDDQPNTLVGPLATWIKPLTRTHPPMTQPTWTNRQRREAQFYQQYASIQEVEEIDFAPVMGLERRPWNPYWYVYEYVRQNFVNGSQKLLDFGCGIGIAALRFAYLGYQVEGFDISSANIQIAQKLASRHNLSQRATFRSMAAEKLDYPDDFFDVVVGIDILHHVEIEAAIQEARRVLKPGGIAIFKEHMEVPVVDPIRNTALVRKIAPNNPSLDHHITADERKLCRADLDVIQRCFDRVETQRFTLVSRLDRLLPKSTDALRGRLEKLDRRLMRLCKPLAELGGTAVLICSKTSAEAAKKDALAA